MSERPPGYRSLFSSVEFRLLWLGESAGRFGFQLINFLLPLIAVTVLGASGTEVGLISAVQFLPVVLFALIAGALAGRAPLRALLVTCNGIRAGALAFLVVVQLWAHLTLGALLVVAVLVGAATVFYDVGFQASIPHAVSVEQIAPANGLLQATYSVAELGGAAIAGFLLQKVGVNASLVTALVLFGCALASFAGLRVPSSRAAEPESVARSISRGARYVWQCRPIRDLCLQAGVFNMFEQAFLTVFLVYAVRGLGISGGVVGLVVGVGSLGALTGALVAPKVRFVRVGVLVSSGLPAAALAFLLVPLFAGLFPGAVPPLALAFLLNGVSVAFFNVFAVSLRQSIPPAELLGATTAAYRLVSYGPIPLGALLGGLAIDHLGGRPALWSIGAVLTAICLLFQTSPLRSIVDVAQARELSVVPATARTEEGR